MIQFSRMARRPIRNYFTAAIAVAWISFVAMPSLSSAFALQGDEKFMVQLRNGDMIEVTTPEGEFVWLSIAADGTSTNRTINVSDIASLEFATEPASAQVAEARVMINELGNENYQARQEAEERLWKEGAPFIEIIEQAEDHPDPEVRYRVKRILKQLRKKSKSTTQPVYKLEFDLLVMKSGEEIEGDIGEFGFDCEWAGGSVRFDRTNCWRVMREAETVSMTFKPLPASAEIEVVGIDDIGFFREGGGVKEGFHFDGFETDANGNETVKSASKDARELLLAKGCLLDCVSGTKGWVMVAGYRFKNSESGTRSIANRYFDKQGKSKSYRGVMQIDFCVPNHPRLPATISSIGMLLEITEPKHTILDAYNSAGHIIGSIYCGAKKTSAVGIDTNSRIAYVRIRANPFLDVEQLEDGLNEDFAADDLYFDDPVWAPEINFGTTEVPSQRALITAEGKRLSVKAFRFDKANNQIVFTGLDGFEDFSLPNEKVAWLLGQQSYDWQLPDEEGVYVMTKDGSVVFCEVGNGLTVADSDLSITAKDIAGVWGKEFRPRYPQKGDFDHGKTILVDPLHRIGFQETELDLSSGKFEFQMASAKTIRQPTAPEKANQELAGSMIDGKLVLEATAEDFGATEEISSIDLGKCRGLWMTMPSSRDATTGLLRMNDGQQFVIGEGAFQLTNMDGEFVTLKRDGAELKLRVDFISAFQLPVN